MDEQKSILVIDDEPDFLEVIGSYFQELPYDFSLAENAARALELLEYEGFDIVVIDIKFSQLKEQQLLERLKQDWPGIILLVMTSYGESSDEPQLLATGAIDHIVKPFSFSELQIRLQGLVHKKQAQVTLENLSAQLEVEVDRRTLDLRNANEELQKLNKRYQDITQAITNYIYTVKVEKGRSVNSIHNSACVAVTGYTAEELSHSSTLWLDMIPVADHPLVLGQIEQIFAHNKAGVIEHRIIKKDDTIRWISNTPNLNYNGEGELVSYDGVVCDITERKIAEQRLQKAHDELDLRVKQRTKDLNLAIEQLSDEIAERQQIEYALIEANKVAEKANESKSEFLANMSHEIRTPMNAILGMTKLAGQADVSDKVRNYLNIVETSGNILLGVINDILDFSKMESGKLNIENINFNLHDILNNLETMFMPKSVETGNELIITTQANIPDFLIGDPLRLGQILVNLVSNAMKFTNHGRITVNITSRDVSADKIELQFSVIDTGIGIAASRVQKIFNPYTQADGSMTRRFGGTGLGLTICGKLIKLMNGDIRVTSVLGEGSNFTITLVIGLQPIEEIFQPAAYLPRRKILITDDDPLIVTWLTKELELFGFEVESATKPSEAFRKLHNATAGDDAQFDLLLLDMMMPAYSTAILPPIPCESCHLIHGKVATHSMAILPPQHVS